MSTTADRRASRLAEVLRERGSRIVADFVVRSRARGMAQLAAPSPEAWAEAAAGLAEGIVAQARSRTRARPAAVGGVPPHPPGTRDPVAGFVVREARRHRARGIPLPLFLGMLKEMRDVFLDHVASALPPGDVQPALAAVRAAFDRFEVAACADWEAGVPDRRVAEMQAEARAQSAEKARLGTIVDGLPVAVLMLESGGDIRLLNRAAATAFLPESDAPGGTGARARFEDVLPDLVADVRTFEAGSAAEAGFEREVRTAAGPRWFQVRLRKTIDMSERFLGTVIILNDITARRAAEDSLRAAHAELDRLVRERSSELGRATETLATVVRHAPLAMIAADREGVVRIWNPAAERMFGWTAGEVVGRPNPFLRGPDGAAIRANLERVVSGGRAVHFEVVRHRKDGTAVEVSSYVAPLRGLSGEVEGVIGILRDVAEQRRADHELRESEERYRTLVEMCPDAIIVHQDGRLVFANRAALALVGATSRDQLVGRPIKGFVHPDDLPLVLRRVAEMMAGRRVPATEETFLRLDGSPVEVEVSAAPTSFRGRPAVQVLAHDIRSRRSAEATMRRQAEDLEAHASALRALRAIDREMVQHLYPDDMLRAVLGRLPSHVGADAIAVGMLDDDANRIVSNLTRTTAGDLVEEDLVVLDPAAFSEVVDGQALLFVDPVSADPRVRVVGPWEGPPPAWYLGVPMVVRGRAIGVLHVVSSRPGAGSGEVTEFFRMLAWRLAIGIENARAFADTTHRAEVVELLLAAQTGLGREGPGSVSAEVLEVLARACGTDRAVWFRHDALAGSLVFESHAGFPAGLGSTSGERMSFPFGESRGVVGAVAASRTACHVPDCQADPRWITVDPSVRSAYFVPVQFGDRPYGVVGILGRRPWGIHASHRALADLFGHYVGAMLEGARLLAQTREAEQRYRSIFENAVEGIYQRAPDGRLIAANPALARMLGFGSVDEILGAETDVGRLLHGSREREQAFRRELEAHGVVRGFECQARRRDGSPVWTSENARAVRGPDGELVRVEGLIEDVTERKELERQLRHAQRMEAVGRLAGGIAHDFNNLLTAIMGYSALLMDRIPATDPVRRDVEEVWNAGRRAAALTGQLLAFSRRQVLQPAALDLNAVVDDTQKMLRRLIGEDVRLETALAAKGAGITADRGQVEQVIVNLAVNARDAMLGGGVLTVGTADADLAEPLEGDQGVAVPAGRWVELWVRDTGCGMDAETRAHAFEPFFTTKGPGKGTGLGLAVVYGIVKQSGGYVFVTSAPGRGAHFRIFLPRNDAAPRPAAAGVVVSERPRGTETILVVEDEDAVRVLVCDVLNRCGYDVIPAADGPEAMDIVMARAGAIHMLLTDVVMPGMNGRQLADQVLAVNRQVRVVFTSGYTDGDAMFLGLLRDGAVFLQKPFDPAHLARVVREQLDGT